MKSYGVPEGNHIHGNHYECKLPSSTQDIINCALNFHPIVRRNQSQLEVTKALSEVAEISPNPRIATKFLSDESKGTGINSIETSLSFPLETGGKKRSRLSFAKAKIFKKKIDINRDTENIKIDTLLKLHRLRQIEIEKHALLKTLTSFRKVIKKLKKLSRLSAQQEGSLALFEIAANEISFDNSVLYEEERSLEHYFHIATGHSLAEITPFFPRVKGHWPSIKNEYASIKNSLEVKSYLAQEAVGETSLSLERSKGWSNIHVGPSFNLNKSETESSKSIGLSVRFDLPLFHTNDGERIYAKKVLAMAQRDTQFILSQNKHERTEQVRVYRSSVSVLKNTMNVDKVNLKYNRIQKLYLRGVISKSVFMESQKQKNSYIKNRHEREMSALSSLWSIYRIDGNVLKVEI
jgi:cobalt-zinc-cadmium efflux system outer membrane protein